MRRFGRIGAIVVVSALFAVACGAIPYDFDAIRGADIVWQADDGRWFQYGVADPIFVGAAPAEPNGWTPDQPVAGDYDGDGRTEPAVVRDGAWVTAGAAGTLDAPPPAYLAATSYGPWAVPVSADYDGDGRTDPAWFRRADAVWFIPGRPPLQLGRPSPSDLTGVPAYTYDVPVPADYDGDGVDEPAVYDPTTGTWTSTQGIIAQDGGPGWMPVPADYDGDGRDETAVVGVSLNGHPDMNVVWRVPGRSDFVIPGSTLHSVLVPTAADHDADGRADPGMAPTHVEGDWLVGADQPASYHVGRGAPGIVPFARLESLVRLTFYGRCVVMDHSCSVG